QVTGYSTGPQADTSEECRARPQAGRDTVPATGFADKERSGCPEGLPEPCFFQAINAPGNFQAIDRGSRLHSLALRQGPHACRARRHKLPVAVPFPEALQRCVRQDTPPVYYEGKIQRGIAAPRNSSQDIRSISKSLDFRDSSTFGRLVRRTVGVYPSRFRN